MIWGDEGACELGNCVTVLWKNYSWEWCLEEHGSQRVREPMFPLGSCLELPHSIVNKLLFTLQKSFGFPRCQRESSEPVALTEIHRSSYQSRISKTISYVYSSRWRNWGSGTWWGKTSHCQHIIWSHRSLIRVHAADLVWAPRSFRRLNPKAVPLS